MTSDEALVWLNSTQLFGVKLGLENTARLLEAVGNPHRRLRVIHAAGTNGKGSVCALLDSVLRCSGLRCGLYTSPHLVSFRERIRVNGQPIPPEKLAASLSALRDACADWDHSPTFFEISTVAALDHFAREGCEIVVLETGMGGRLDATNIVTPLVSVITPIAMDHAEWLGNSLEEIAGEKAGIIKPGVPVVSAQQSPEVLAVLKSRAGSLASSFSVADAPFPHPIGLAGSHQQWNAALAVAALHAAGCQPSEDAISRGLREVTWPARFQQVRSTFVVDGAHNPHAACSLVSTWQEAYGPAKTTVIFGSLQDKDYAEMLSILSSISESFLFVPIANPRGADPSIFPALTSIPSTVCANLAQALARPAATCPALITGSLFLAGDALHLLDPGAFPR